MVGEFRDILHRISKVVGTLIADVRVSGEDGRTINDQDRREDREL